MTSVDFNACYACNDDPWHIESRWYERRKRALILAALPFETTELIVEPGCGTGALSVLLAERCDRLMSCDVSAKAISLAQRRMLNAANIEFSVQKIPEQWPVQSPDSTDCIILSEIGYYLSDIEILGLVDRIAATLKPSGFLVGCHWRGQFTDRTLATSILHDRLEKNLGLKKVMHHLEQDFVLDIWSRDGRSIAMQEGFA